MPQTPEMWIFTRVGLVQNHHLLGDSEFGEMQPAGEGSRGCASLLRLLGGKENPRAEGQGEHRLVAMADGKADGDRALDLGARRDDEKGDKKTARRPPFSQSRRFPPDQTAGA